MRRNTLPTRFHMFALLALCMSGARAVAGQAVGIAVATVIAPVSVEATDPYLRFGAFSTTGGGQTVTIGPDGARTLQGVQAATGAAGEQFGPAVFTVKGERSLTFRVDLPASATLTTGAGSARETMLLTGFSSQPATAGILRQEAELLRIGATLTTVAGQAVGAYRGSFTVTVSYD